MKDCNSSVNQRIKGQFIEREVFAQVNSMVEYILSSEGRNKPFDYDDIQNMYIYPEYRGEYSNFDGGTEDQKEEEIDRLNEYLQARQDAGDKEETLEDIQAEIDDLENLETEPQEIYEWWLVSSYLIDKLKEQGEPVIEDENIWGRTCSGQAILLDGSISRICSDMEILEGQANDWSK